MSYIFEKNYNYFFHIDFDKLRDKTDIKKNFILYIHNHRYKFQRYLLELFINHYHCLRYNELNYKNSVYHFIFNLN